MNPYRIYTRKTMGLDNRVWRLMFVIILLSVGLLSYRLLDKEKCISFSFAVKALGLHTNDVFYTGETLSFIASTPSKEISWNFGDNTGSLGATVYHQFLKEGIYLVTAGSNSLCKIEKEITVKNQPVVVQSADNAAGTIAGRVSCYTYEEQIYSYTGSAKSYDWSVPNHQSLGTKSGQTITYTFPYAGKYTLQVELDGDRNKRHVLEVIVEDKVKPKSQVSEKVTQLIPYTPPPPAPQRQEELPPPVIKPAEPDLTRAEPSNNKIFIAPVTFKEYLKKVANKEMGVQDFDKYLCGGGGTPVIVNGNKNDVTTFSSLCQEISGKKKKLIFGKKTVEIIDVQLQKINGCVTIIDVHYKWQ
ncbi:MAG: PKD domain-containing protein [Ginsengibacter sp.]